jgi:TM2 domain-containing membrane protein YozV
MKEPAAIVPKTNLPKVKSVGKATWLSLIFGGAGQIYLGQVKKGMVDYYYFSRHFYNRCWGANIK